MLFPCENMAEKDDGVPTHLDGVMVWCTKTSLHTQFKRIQDCVMIYNSVDTGCGFNHTIKFQ